MPNPENFMRTPCDIHITSDKIDMIYMYGLPTICFLIIYINPVYINLVVFTVVITVS